MPRETPQQRYRRLKRDPLRGAVLAPKQTVEPVRCAREGCAHARLMHGFSAQLGTECLSYGCSCEKYREAP